MRTYCIVNRKGGVGKTTTAVATAYNFAQLGERVLLIDADSQGNASSLISRRKAPWGLEAVLKGECSTPDEVIDHSIYTNLDIIPATEALGDYELACTVGQSKPNFHRLRELLEELAAEDRYDRVLIDCPPYYSVSCISALAACDSTIIPVTLDAYAAEGMEGLVRQIDNIRSACPAVKVSGILITHWTGSMQADDAACTLYEKAPVPVFDSVIRRSDKVTESTWAGMAVGDWSPRSAAARDYKGFVQELIKREEAEKHV